MRRRHAVVAGAVMVLTLGTAGCTSGRGTTPNTPAPSTRTIVTGTSTRPAPGTSFTPAPATSVAALGNRSTAPKGEKFGRCPYIANGASVSSDGDPFAKTIANLEGDRVGRSTILTRYTPVACRFYFAYSYGDTRHEAVADILPTTFATAADAHNALVLTARAGRSLQSQPNFVPGVDGIQYQTRFFGPDGARDWAFAFAKGKILVVVHTQQNNVQDNALNIGKAIVGKF